MIINAADWQRPKLAENANIEKQVRQMLKDILLQGDSAIELLAQKFDQQTPQTVQLKPFEEYGLNPNLASSIRLAAKRIKKFARFQIEGVDTRSFTDEYGTYSQVVSPIKRIGAYIPGGRHPLISTALMTLIPAKVAGCPIRIACSPSVNPALLAAASLAGATQFIQIGGVQAIAALAYGYADNLPVDLIVGPGNAWVNEAKKQLQGKVKIDGLAGPSELMALCDDQQPIEWLALDALAQAEHDPMACSLIVSDSLDWLTKMKNYLMANSTTLKMIEDKQISLIHAASIEQMIELSENYAAEHLMLCHQNIVPTQLTNYGSLFVGANSAVALGDYITGSNHTLPTLGYAKQSGGLSVNNFLRILTVQQINDSGCKSLSHSALALAEAEGLSAHYQSLLIRCEK